MDAAEPNFLEFVTQLYTASDLDQAFLIYDQHVQRLGFEGALYAYIPRIYLEYGLRVAPVFKVSSTRDRRFMQHYQEAGFEQHDFTVRAIFAGYTDPIDWWHEERKGVLSAQERNVILTAREDYGIRHGISISTMHNAVGIAGASVVSRDSDPHYQQLVRESFTQLKLYTELFHEHVMARPYLHHYFLLPLLECLTPKEKQLLSFLVIGKPMKSAHLPNSTHKYSDKLLSSVRKKWGGITKARLIYYIGALRLLDHL